MPIPKPRKKEPKDKFMGRCVSFLRNEGKPNEQAVAICFSQWERKGKADVEPELDSQNKNKPTTT